MIINIKINGLGVLSKSDKGKWHFGSESDNFVNPTEDILHTLENQHNQDLINITKTVNKNLQKANIDELFVSDIDERKQIINDAIKQFKNNKI